MKTQDTRHWQRQKQRQSTKVQKCQNINGNKKAMGYKKATPKKATRKDKGRSNGGHVTFVVTHSTYQENDAGFGVQTEICIFKERGGGARVTEPDLE
jgi:hypothetical protein